MIEPFGMDNLLLGVVATVIAAVSVAFGAWIKSQYKQRKESARAAQWVPVQATVQSGALEGTREIVRNIAFPTFAFSYKVSDEYYSGRFCLRANLSRAHAESMIQGMIGRRVLVRYDPDRPEVWFIPEERIDGYEVGQKLGSHVLRDYSPND